MLIFKYIYNDPTNTKKFLAFTTYVAFTYISLFKPLP